MSFGEPTPWFPDTKRALLKSVRRILNKTQKCKVHAAPCSFWSVSPTVIFGICPDVPSTDLESVMVLSQSTDSKSVLWLFWTDLKSVTFGATHPYRLQICHPQIVSYFSTDSRFVGGSGVDRFQNCTGRQIPNLSDRRKYRFQICQPQHPPTDFKSVTCTVSNLVGTRLGSDKTQICKVQSQPLRPWTACQQSTPSCQVSR